MTDNDNYRGLAEYYDFFTLRPLASCRSSIAAICRRNDFSRVVDLACGTGALAFLLWGESGIKVTGLDSSPAMLEKCRERSHDRQVLLKNRNDGVNANGTAAPDFILGQAEATPFAEKSFEVAVLSLVLHETRASPIQLIAEASRIAKHVLILDYRLAERNLELPAIFAAHIPEFLAGREHYANFRRYMRHGALQGLVYQARQSLGLHCLHEVSCGGGALGLVLCAAQA